MAVRKLGEHNKIDNGNMTSANNVVINVESIDVSDSVISVVLPEHTIMGIEIPLY